MCSSWSKNATRLEDLAGRPQDLDAPHARRGLPGCAEQAAQAHDGENAAFELVACPRGVHELAQHGAPCLHVVGRARGFADRAREIAGVRRVRLAAESNGQAPRHQLFEVHVARVVRPVPRGRRERRARDSVVEGLTRPACGEREDQRLAK
jgi:hypothetical protein